MNYNLELAFDFKNSKEYFVRCEPIEITNLVKIPKKLKNSMYLKKLNLKPKKLEHFCLNFLI